jgi:16S rRNA (guanine527-N7)-methyltransferase
VDLDAEQVGILRRHFDQVCDLNRVMNLTRVTDPEEAVQKLYLSSFALFPALVECGVVIEGLFQYLDLGTGAGFPGVPVAVAAPHLSGLLLDSRGKKAEFVAGALEKLGLDRFSARKGRGASLANVDPSLAEHFDLVTARAVTTVAKTLHEVKDLVTRGGFVAIYKGPNLSQDEIEEGEVAAEAEGFIPLGTAEIKVEDLSPRILIFSRWSAGDEGAYA